jgi:hypothetical protein
MVHQSLWPEEALIMTVTEAHEIITRIIKQPVGGTIPIRGHALPEHGYMVGGGWPPVVFQPERTAVEIRSRLSTYIMRLPTPYVGWWVDSRSGRLYVDGSDWFAVREDAERVARGRGELAFWDLSADAEIRLDT